MVALAHRQVDPVLDGCAFIREHLPIVRGWPEGRLEAWWTWYWQHKLAAVLTDGPRVVAVAAVRVIDTRKPEMLLGAQADYAHDPAGNCVFVAGIAVAEGYRARLMPQLWQVMETTVGRRDYIAFGRTKYMGRLRIHSFDKFGRLIQAGTNVETILV
jgi:hypothetical protein